MFNLEKLRLSIINIMVPYIGINAQYVVILCEILEFHQSNLHVAFMQSVVLAGGAWNGVTASIDSSASF